MTSKRYTKGLGYIVGGGFVGIVFTPTFGLLAIVGSILWMGYGAKQALIGINEGGESDGKGENKGSGD